MKEFDGGGVDRCGTRTQVLKARGKRHLVDGHGFGEDMSGTQGRRE